MQNEHSPHVKLRPRGSSRYIQSGHLGCSDARSNVKILLKENTSVISAALSYAPFKNKPFFFLNTLPKHTLEGTLRRSENKPFDLLYKHNSISHTSVCVRVCVCRSFKAPLFPVKKRGTRLWTM